MGLAQAVAPRKPRDPVHGGLALERGDELENRSLALAAHHVGSVLKGLLDVEADVRAAEDHRHPRGGKLVGQGIPRGLSRRRARNPDKVGDEALAEVNRSKHLAEHSGVMPALGEHRGHQRQAQTRQQHVVVDALTRGTRLDQADTQTHS
jgi:hypothetical protein